MPSDTNSLYPPSPPSSGFTSLSSDLFPHVNYGGRRFQNFLAGRYPLPNDGEEALREEFLHACLEMVFGGLWAGEQDFGEIQKVLDLGTGSGVWAVAVADKYPMAHVTGVDLSYMQPHLHPPNVTWRIDDIEADWPSPYQNQDLVNLRGVISVIRHLPTFARRAFGSLNPTGMLHMSDPIFPLLSSKTGRCPPNYLPNTLLQQIVKSHENQHRFNYRNPLILPGHLATAGFGSITVTRIRIPVNEWTWRHKIAEIGAYMHSVIDGFITGAIAGLEREGLVGEEYKRIIEKGDWRGELGDTSSELFVWWVVVTAKRPGPGEWMAGEEIRWVTCDGLLSQPTSKEGWDDDWETMGRFDNIPQRITT